MVSLTSYFFLYPAGHFGFVAVIFFDVLPLMHVIVVFWFFCTTGIVTGSAEGVGEGDAADGVTGCAPTLCVTFTFMVGAE